MGYTTHFKGRFSLDRQLEGLHARYLLRFVSTRRMRRDSELAGTMPDPIRTAIGLPIGPDAAYFVGGRGNLGQDHDESVVDYNWPPAGQPSLWCQWIPDAEWGAIVWNGAEKFYEYDRWLEYLIEHFLEPWGYTLNGEVSWAGEARGDTGVLRVVDNEVEAIPTDDPRDPALFEAE